MSAASTKKSGGKWKETRHDKYYHLAKEQGYRSRAAFKLIQLNKKYNFLNSCRSLLDLCAAPGGWLQVAAKTMPVSSLIVGVDLLPIKAIRGVTTLKEDITTQTCRQKLKKIFNGWDCDVVVHDGAPNVGGSTWAADAYAQNELVILSLKLATEFLREGGTFVTKVFRSQDYNSLLWVLNHFFKRCDVTKPAASRNASAEIFIVCQHYLAPKTIDPKLLDPHTIFQHFESGEQAAAKQVHDVFKQKINPKPNRSGYDDHMPMHMTRTVPVSSFVDAEEPIVMLGTYSAFTFTDEKDQMYATHADTTIEIKTLCEDLKVLGKGDFKSLLKWRKKMRDYRKQLETEEVDEQEDTDMTETLTEEEKKEKQEQELTEQLEGLAAKQIKQKLKEKKKKREVVNKQRRRNLVNANNLDGVAETSTELDLFSMGIIPSEQALDSVADVAVDDEDEIRAISLNGEWDDGDEIRDQDSELSSSDTETNYYEKLESDLDSMYDQYRNRRKMINKKKAALSLDGEAEEDAEIEQEGEEEMKQSLQSSTTHTKHQNPLLIEFDDEQDTKTAQKERAKRWFERGLFADLSTPTPAPAPSTKKHQPIEYSDSDSSDADDEYDDDQRLMDMMDDEPKKGKGKKRNRDDDTTTNNKKPKLVGMSSLVSTTAQRTSVKGSKQQPAKIHQDMSIFDDDDNEAVVPVKAISVRDTRGSKPQRDEEDEDESDDNREPTEFEEVAIESDYSDDSDAKAEVLALGQLMLRKKSREGLINHAYNRYTFEDEDYIKEIDPKTGKSIIKKIELPEWFTDNENEHNKAQLPITKEEVALARSKLSMINARPIKKIAEAKARQKMKTVKRWEKIQSKAMQIAQDDQISSNAEKMKAISKLMHKKDKRTIKKERNYVVSKKSGGTAPAKHSKKGGLTVRVDRRMRADKRGLKSSAKAKKKKMKLANSRKAKSNKK